MLLLLGAGYLPAQDWARQQLEQSPRHRDWVTLKGDGRNVETFVACPESKNKTPVVLIIHEIFGLSDWVQDLGGSRKARDLCPLTGVTRSCA